MRRGSGALSIVAFLALASPGLALDDSPKPVSELADYATVETARTTTITRANPRAVVNLPAYLGVLLDPDSRQDLVIADVDSDSPASLAGVQPGDKLLKLDGRDVKDGDGFAEILRGKSAGEMLEIAVMRQDKPVIARATLTPWSRIKKTSTRPRSKLGVSVAGQDGKPGLLIEEVTPGSAAERAKLKVGEVLLKIDDVALTDPDQLPDLIASKPPESTVVATLLLAEKAVDLKIKLDTEMVADGPAAERRGGGGGGGGGMRAGGGYWTKPGFRLAIVCVEYPDKKHNPQITQDAWRESLFTEGTYNKTNATGQAVHGSLRDYYLEQSYGYFRVDGKVFDWIEVSKKRADYATGNRTALLTEALDKLLERDGSDALKDYDGVFFIYSGERYPAPRGSLYWPHRASLSHKGKRWPYFIIEEGGPRMQGLAVLCHEFGHMLGLPDLYAQPENPGMEGAGVWCAMSQQPNRMIPQHFSAWSKEKVGWLKPAVIDPTVKQKLVLAPIEDSPKECFKVLVRPDGSEYILLENRKKKGFDQSLPAEGLLIWHVLANRPSLQESHGIEGPNGPRLLMNEVPYPSAANDAYTPFTTPSSRSPLGGGPPVSITNIRRLPDGRISFQIGYEYQ